jgi:hypothetical protein
MAIPWRHRYYQLAFLVIALFMFVSVWTDEAGWRAHMVTAFIAAAFIQIINWCRAELIRRGILRPDPVSNFRPRFGP